MKILEYEYNGSVIDLSTDEGAIRIEVVKDSIFRCIYSKSGQFQNQSLMVSYQELSNGQVVVEDTSEDIRISSGDILCSVQRDTGIFTWYNRKTGKLYVQEAGKELSETDVIKYSTGGEPPMIDRVKTVDGERNFIRNLKANVDRVAYRGRLHFNWQEEEGIFGLGQAEEGVYNYRHHNQYLYQHNMRIPIPFFISTNSYGILFDCCSLMTFQDDHNGSYVFMDTIEQMDYYFIAGDNFDQIIDGYRYLTGKATMLPKWSFGYVQSKEAYKTGDELVDVVKQYRELGVPFDCIVQDWNTWEPGDWGQKTVDKNRFPNLSDTMKKIHDMNAHAMVSIWPNMNPGGKNHQEFFDHGYLLNDYSTYNAFDEKAREMYFNQANEELFQGGFDSWWCDSTEPFSGPDWGGDIRKEPFERYTIVGNEHKHYLDATQANAFALMHAKGVYENQRKITTQKRVLNLTRSGYSSGQKYGTVLWSGDISASWSVLKKQIVEGLNFALSGMPYWTLDIGGFFVVGSAWQKRGCNCSNNPNPLWFWKGEYNDGVDDLAYRELYVRWLEYGTFLPMFRSHGTDTPREIWNFGTKGEMFYDAIEKFIKLRYQLMPYIYSLAGNVWRENGTMLRSLLFDYLSDSNVKGIEDEFMFGSSFLVCPVTEPMYYEVGSMPLTKEKKKTCYLPIGNEWYDYWTGEKYQGGNFIVADTPIDQIPLFIKAGSIIPTQDGLQYADEKVEIPMVIHVYEGADGSFTLYEDEGDNYNFEQGNYAVIQMNWDDQNKIFYLGQQEGEYPGMTKDRTLVIRCGDKEKSIEYNGNALEVSFLS